MMNHLIAADLHREVAGAGRENLIGARVGHVPASAPANSAPPRAAGETDLVVRADPLAAEGGEGHEAFGVGRLNEFLAGLIDGIAEPRLHPEGDVQQGPGDRQSRSEDERPQGPTAGPGRPEDQMFV